MPLKLYKLDLSPPACAAMMIFEIHNVPVEMIDMNLLEKEQLKPEYIKKNPMHTIPLLEDDDDAFFIHDSHVILTYISDKYGKGDSLYPKDLKKRALVDQKLHFDALLFYRVKTISFSVIFEGLRQIPVKNMDAVRECYDFLEAFLTKTKFVASDNMTIADVSIIPTLAAASYVVPIDDKKYPKILAWFSYMEKQPFYQKRTAEGTKQLKELLQKAIDQ